MRWLMALLLMVGLLLAGSDGPLFPWPNVVGLLLLFSLFALADREENARSRRR